MICYALATCFNDDKINWYTTEHALNRSHLFAQNTTNQWKKEVRTLCNKLEAGVCDSYMKENNYLYALKLNAGYSFIACDVQLNIQQIKWLGYYLLIKKIAPDEVANNLEKYTIDYQVEAIKEQITETIEELKKDIEGIIESGQKIEDLIEQTNKLPAVSFRFHHTPVSTFPSCTLI